MNSSRFDELTKALARPTSRRQALKGALGALVGGVVATFLPGRAALAGTSACAHFCDSVFGADTPAAMQCISDAAHHKGLCYTCGPASAGGTKSICCPKNASGSCTSYSSATCCGSSATCLGGSCCANANVCGSTCLAAPCAASQCLQCDATTGTCVSSCASGQTCLCNGSCAKPCPCDASCGGCASDISRAEYCFNFGSQGPTCTTDCDCPPGKFCDFLGNCAFLCLT